MRGTQELRATPSHFKLRATPSRSEPLQATPSYSELLRATQSYSEWGAPKNSELFRATSNCSQPFRASNREYQAPWKSQRVTSCTRKFELTDSTGQFGITLLHLLNVFRSVPGFFTTYQPSYIDQSELLPIFCTPNTPNCSEQPRATQSYSEWGAPKNSELLRAASRNSEHTERLGRAASSERDTQKSI